jgi:hypothetical protein
VLQLPSTCSVDYGDDNDDDNADSYEIMTNHNDDNFYDYDIDYSGVDNNNCYEDNYDNGKITCRLRKTVYFSGPVNHDHNLTVKNMSLYELN